MNPYFTVEQIKKVLSGVSIEMADLIKWVMQYVFDRQQKHISFVEAQHILQSFNLSAEVIPAMQNYYQVKLSKTTVFNAQQEVVMVFFYET